jgi:hypothetical protein
VSAVRKAWELVLSRRSEGEWIGWREWLGLTGRKDDAHKNWFFWVLFVIVVVTLLTELVYQRSFTDSADDQDHLPQQGTRAVQVCPFSLPQLEFC